MINSVVFCIICILSTVNVVNGEHVFASTAHMKILADGERQLMSELSRYIEAEQQKLADMTRLLAEVKAASQNTAIDNPLQAFHLIRRFATTWRSIWAVASNFTSFQGLKSAITQLKEFQPADSDLTSAMLSIVRLQKTYALQVSDLSAGRVLDHTAAPLDQQTMFDIALVCLGNGEPDAAIEWLNHAHNYTSGVATVPLPALYQAFGRAYAQKRDYLSATDYIRKAIELDPRNSGYLTDILPPPEIQVESFTPKWRSNYFKLCQRGAYGHVAPADNSVDCRLQPSRVVPFLRHKLEFLHRSPDVALFHDFVTDRESQHLRDMATSKIDRARVGSTVESTVSEVRVGKIAWFYDKGDEPLVRRISRRAADVTGLNMTYPTAEPLQMSNYGLGGHYEPHFDHDEHRFERTELAPELEQNGDRIATFMIYLNDVKVGGATVFTQLKLAAKPVKNAAIFWFNYKRSGQMEPLSLHAACPVLIGEKWVANKWIREYGQEFTRPCALDSNEQSQLSR